MDLGAPAIRDPSTLNLEVAVDWLAIIFDPSRTNLVPARAPQWLKKAPCVCGARPASSAVPQEQVEAGSSLFARTSGVGHRSQMPGEREAQVGPLGRPRGDTPTESPILRRVAHTGPPSPEAS